MQSVKVSLGTLLQELLKNDKWFCKSPNTSYNPQILNARFCLFFKKKKKCPLHMIIHMVIKDLLYTLGGLHVILQVPPKVTL